MRNFSLSACGQRPTNSPQTLIPINTSTMATTILNDISCEAIKPPPSLQKIALHTCLMYGVSISEVKGDSRRKVLVDVRQSISKEAYNNGYSYEAIADFFGHADHTTVRHYIKERVA